MTRNEFRDWVERVAGTIGYVEVERYDFLSNKLINIKGTVAGLNTYAASMHIAQGFSIELCNHDVMYVSSGSVGRKDIDTLDAEFSFTFDKKVPLED